MIKNLEVNLDTKIKVSKTLVNNAVSLLKKKLDFEISSLIINFVSAAKITEINKRFLNHNYSTDIITFSYSEVPKNLDSEIYISVDDAAGNAGKFKVTLKEELLRLIIHGILHLTGYDDKNSKDRAKMKLMENKLLNSCKIALL